MTEPSPADTLRAAAKALRPSSPAVAALTVSVQVPPAAADALARLLDQAADALTGVDVNDDEPALAVARAILGDQP